MQSTFRHLLSINSVKLSGARLEHQQLLTASHKTPRNVEQHLFLGLQYRTVASIFLKYLNFSVRKHVVKGEKNWGKYGSKKLENQLMLGGLSK